MAIKRSGDFGQSPHLSDSELVDSFKAGQTSGRLVMERLLGRLDLGHRAEEVLIGRNGDPVSGEQGELRIADYMTVASSHGAEQAILGFLLVGTDDPEYPDYQQAMANLVNGYLPAQTTQPDLNRGSQ